MNQVIIYRKVPYPLKYQQQSEKLKTSIYTPNVTSKFQTQGRTQKEWGKDKHILEQTYSGHVIKKIQVVSTQHPTKARTAKWRFDKDQRMKSIGEKVVIMKNIYSKLC